MVWVLKQEGIRFVFSPIIPPVCYPGSQALERHSKDSRSVSPFHLIAGILISCLLIHALGHTNPPTHLRARTTVTGVPVFQADELLCSSYQLYKHTETNEIGTILRTVASSLPADGAAHARANGRADDARAHYRRDDDTQTTPDFLRWLYRTEAYVTVPAARGHNALNVFTVVIWPDPVPSHQH